MKSKYGSVFTFILFLAVSYPVSCGKKDSGLKEKCRICKSIAADFEKVYGRWLKIHRSIESRLLRLWVVSARSFRPIFGTQFLGWLISALVVWPF